MNNTRAILLVLSFCFACAFFALGHWAGDCGV